MMNQHEYLGRGLGQRHQQMLVVRRLEQLQRYYQLLLKPSDEMDGLSWKTFYENG